MQRIKEMLLPPSAFDLMSDVGVPIHPEEKMYIQHKTILQNILAKEELEYKETSWQMYENT